MAKRARDAASVTPDQERELRELAQTDPRRAVEWLVDAYGKDILRYCRNFLGSQADAEDSFQAVFLQALQDLPRFEGRAPIRSWLFTIARHRCIDCTRGLRRRAAQLMPDTDVDAEDSAGSTEATLVDVALVTALEECLDRLAPRHRAAMVMKYHDGFSYKEMASILKATDGALRVRVLRTLSKLRDCMETKGYSL